MRAQGENIAVGAVTLSGSQLDLTGSQTQANAITLVANSGDITLTEAGVNATTQLSASTTAVLRSDNGRLIAEQITLDADALSNVGGLIAQTGATDFNLNLPGYVDNRDGTLLATGHIEMKAERLDSNSGSLLAAGVQRDGRLTDTGDLAVATRQGLIVQGRTLAAGAMTLTGSGVDLSGSQTQARKMNVIANSGDVSTLRVNILSLGSLTISAGANAGQTLNNHGGTLAANNIFLNLGQFDSSAGKITANQDLTINLQSDFSNQAGSTLQTGRDLTFTTSGALANGGQLLAGGKFNTNSSSLLNNGQISVAQADLRTAGGLNNSGEILTSDILSTYCNTLFNSGTMISAAATLKARERITNSGPKALIGDTNENGTLALLAPVIENSDTVTYTDTAPTTTILGMGKVILAGGQDSSGNYQTTARVLNLSSLTESGKDLLVYANTLTNSRHILTANTKFVTGNTVNGSAYWTAGNPDIPGGRYAEPPRGGRMNSDYIGTNYKSTLAYNSIDKISPEAQLLIGGNFTPQVGTLENRWSKVNAQGEINLSGVTLQQDGWGNAQRLVEKRTSTGAWRYRTYKGGLWSTGWGPEVRERTTNQYASSITAKTISGSGTIIHNGANPGAIAPPSERDSTGKNIAVEFNGISLTLPVSGLYPQETLSFAQINTPSSVDAMGKGAAAQIPEVSLTPSQVGLRPVNTAGGQYGPYPQGTLSFAQINTPSSVDATGKGAAAQIQEVSLTPSQIGLRSVNTAGGQYGSYPQGRFSFAHINPSSPVNSPGQRRESAQPDTINTAILALPYRAVSGGYLVETHPAFANLNHWRGSDYVLQQLNSDPAALHKRLGDNLYEQRLVRDQVLALTGQAIASDYRSAQEQYEQLFAAGLEYSKAFNIALGTNLSAEQMAVLTRNIVLMETREVVGQSVLVPVVYLARVKPGELHANDALIAAEHIALTDVQGFTNQGAIKATYDLQISMAQDTMLNSRGGLLQAGNNMQLSTLNSDIDLTSARLNATNLQLDSGRDVLLRTASDQLSSGNGGVLRTQTILGPLASINVGHNAVINTQRDFIQQGAGVNIGQDLQVNTGGDWILNTVQRSDQIRANYGHGSAISKHLRHLASEVNIGGALTARVDNFTAVGATINAGTINVQAQNIDLSAATDRLLVTGESSSKRHSNSVALYDETLLGSQLNAKGDINLQAAHDINLSASTAQTDGALKLAAGGDITLTTQIEQHDALRSHIGKSNGLASTTTTRIEDNLSWTLAVSSLLSAGTIDIGGKNIAVMGSNLVADNDVRLRAQQKLSIGTAQQSASESHLYEQKKSGLSTNGGIGVFIGSNRQKTTDQTHTLSNVGSTIGSLGGNVSLEAINHLNIHGSEVIAGKDIALKGSDVAITAAENNLSQQHMTESKQTGFTLALSGTVGSAANRAVTAAQDAKKESNRRLKALQATKAALSGVQATQAGVLANESGDPNAVDVSISFGSQKGQSKSHLEQTIASGSNIAAGNNLSISATGDKGAGDIRVQGSELQAGRNLSLEANNDIVLNSAENRESLRGSNKSSGGNIGVGIGAGKGAGISIFAGVNASNGKEQGDSLTHTETQLKAGDTVTMTSSRDTRLKGAKVSGETVKVGRDLLLQSEQDINNYLSKQSSASGSFTFASMTGSGSFSASQSKIDSDYTSVQEQTGFFAGSGGTDITVGKHTQLDGAVIASTAIADKNKLDTGTLGFSDLDNQARFTSSTSSVGMSSGGFTGSSDIISNMGGVIPIMGGNSGDATTTTHAAVSDGTIIIRNTDKQQQNVDDLSRDVAQANHVLSPLFDKEKERNRLGEINLIGETGNQVADIARAQGKIAEEKALKDPQALQAAQAALIATGNLTPTDKQVTAQVRNTASASYGTGSAHSSKGCRRPRRRYRALAGGDLKAALAQGSAPYLAEGVKNRPG